MQRQGTEATAGDRLRWRTLLAVGLLYVLCLVAATFPVWQTFLTRFPSCRGDALQVLWVLRWYRDCLVNGRLPFFCPEAQFPAGAHLGNWSPMHLQALLSIPLSFLTSNDVLCYNLIWSANIVFTGLGTFVLVWEVLRSRFCAFFGGLTAMLSGPMLLHALGHLELVSLGPFPLFLVAWMRWIDRRGLGRLLSATALYLLVAMSAGYFAVFATVPAGLYAVHAATRDGLAGIPVWVRGRFAGLAGFVVLVLPCLALLFSAQLLSRAQGYSVGRSRAEFAQNGAPAWALFVPSRFHHSGQLLPVEPYREAQLTEVETCSYLGLAVLALIGCAAVLQTPFPNRRFWWLVLGVLVVLSWGGPWLYDWCLPFRQVRVPSRFNLPAAVCAAILAAAGLRELLTRLPSHIARVGFVAGLSGVMILDLGVTPWRPVDPVLPVLPDCYAFVRDHAPDEAMLEVPQFPSSACNELASACTWWQALHHGRTSAGYSGYPNVRYERLAYDPSPFSWERLLEPEGCRHSVDVVQDVSLRDYAWLFLTVNRFGVLVLHEDHPDLNIGLRFHLDGLREQLGEALVYRDGSTSVYDRRLLSEPCAPVILCREGWGTRTAFWRRQGQWERRFHTVAKREARLAVFNPSADAELQFQFEAMAVRQPRTVRLLEGQRQLACWTVAPREPQRCSSPPFRLRPGLGELVLESDGEGLPSGQERIGLGDDEPFSLRVAGLKLLSANQAPPFWPMR